ncbi:hypothetical protein [Falsiroseomonas selenitidurans]|uniref:Lipoprotein n=1 Tax=Falsiroseomonas selenitidurans TaxID=2716335 RepID=A0ABX1E3I1_9PROT|nr:hypothetical protein [Falsiroseomonas selenitidurans]NKC30368.1 hypothetical protein [Falsiroseomonas selenitidurans]
MTRIGCLLLLGATLPGCGPLLSEGTSAAAGVGSASLAEAVGTSAAATTGIGLGVQAGARAGLHYAQRRTQRGTQLRVAAAAGPLAVGEVAPWSVEHLVPLQPDEAGQVTVTRRIATGALDCKEIVFSVADPPAAEGAAPGRRFYTATICRDGETWRWANAEPATERWGSLQ